MIAAWVALGAAVGTLVRWQLGRANTTPLHIGTLAVNIIAAFVLGFLVESSADILTIVGVGHLGALSTFSTIVAEVTEDAEGGDRAGAVGYLIVTIAAGIGAALLGIRLA